MNIHACDSALWTTSFTLDSAAISGHRIQTGNQSFRSLKLLDAVGWPPCAWLPCCLLMTPSQHWIPVFHGFMLYRREQGQLQLQDQTACWCVMYRGFEGFVVLTNSHADRLRTGKKEMGCITSSPPSRKQSHCSMFLAQGSHRTANSLR